MNLQVNNNYERIRAHTLSRARNTKFLGSKRACLIARAVPPPPLPHIQTLQDDLLQLTPTPFSHPTQGGGGVIHPPVKTTPSDKRNPKTPPTRSYSYQKEHLFIPKTHTPSHTDTNPPNRQPATTPPKPQGQPLQAKQ